MRIMDSKSDRLENRHLPDSVCIECDCGEHLLWPRRGGNTVTCPTCKRTGTVDIDGMMPLPVDKTPDNPENLPLPEAAPMPSGRSDSDVMSDLESLQMETP